MEGFLFGVYYVFMYMKFLQLLREMDDNQIVNDWKVTSVGINDKGFYTVSEYSAGGDSLSMFHLKLTVLYADNYIDPQPTFEGDEQYFNDDVKEAGINHSYDFIGYASNTPTQNYITDVKFKVIDGSVDFDNPDVSHM
jgi:hypothetical protein